MSSLPPNPSDGEARRDAALNLLRIHRRALVRDLARAAAQLAIDRGTLTADDVRAVVSIPDEIRPVVNGAAMRDLADDGILVKTGEYRPSTRPETHCRPNPVWRLTDRNAALAWLAAHPPIKTD